MTEEERLLKKYAPNKELCQEKAEKVVKLLSGLTYYEIKEIYRMVKETLPIGFSLVLRPEYE
ncbi:hypothetical protein V1387_00725 [Allomuricauda taeanensis]|uniref:hypothetical protein n=1 Tax=Flagellimonas taeanensis TaxID=1005926 RepID=UPI002E7C1DF7|nr:hypothetical protein [Allomuricauda taeanensis]MEE1961186.1 hypothetical protein [Allomuricauda taeanensis]